MSGLDILPNILQMGDLKISRTGECSQTPRPARPDKERHERLGQTGVLIYHLQTGGGWQGVGWALGAGWSEILSLSLSLIT